MSGRGATPAGWISRLSKSTGSPGRALGVGTHNLEATYQPDAPAQAKAFTTSSGTYVQQVQSGGSAVNVTTAKNPAPTGSITFTVTIIGPPQYGPTDVPPVRGRKVKRYKR